MEPPWAVEAVPLRDQVMHISRVTALGELSASLAHELNQPLGAIVSNAQAAKRILTGPKVDVGEVLDALQDIVDDGMRAGNVIRRLRSLLSKDDVEMSSLDMNEIIDSVINLVHSESIIKDIRITVTLDPELPLIYGDRTQLQQVLLNLILNAGEAMNQIEHTERRLIIRTSIRGPNSVAVSVADSGPGLADENLEKLFEPFYTTKPGGLGMGLSINRTIIESHGGRIWAETEPNSGTIFAFTIPVYVRKDT